MAEKPEAQALAQEKLTFLLSLPWMKIFTWGVFFLLVYAMRSFFTVVFLTFIISYITGNVVASISGLFLGREWFRKIVAIVTFAVFLFVAYSGGRFIAPHIMKQGQGVIDTVQGLGLDQGLDKAIPDLYARWQFGRYEKTPEYQEQLEELRKGKDPQELTWEGFKIHAEKLRTIFQEQQLKLLSEARLTEAKEKGAYRTQWLRPQIEKDLYQPKKESLDEEKEEELKEFYKGRFETYKAALGTRYAEEVKQLVMEDLLAGLTDEEMAGYEEGFKKDWLEREGERVVQARARSPEWEAAFEEFYKGRNLATLYDYPYEQFLQLEAAADAAAFNSLVGAEAAEKFGEEALKERVRTERTEAYRKEITKKLRDAKIFDTVNEAVGSLAATLFNWMRSAVQYTLTFAFHLILSIFLSFIIVMDIPRLRRGVELLAHSRVQRLYREIVPGLASFGSLMGRAFQAQAIIAIVNTGLTLLALVILGVGNRAFLCSIVFVCSFIPVAGVFISSVPIALVGLQMEGGGIGLALQLIGAIVIIHLLEAMVFNPKILGDMLHLHPLLVLIILTVGGHYFGVWGLLLGVPVCVHVIRNVILCGVDPGILRRLAPKVARAGDGAAGPEATDQDEGGDDGEDLPEVEAIVQDEPVQDRR